MILLLPSPESQNRLQFSLENCKVQSGRAFLHQGGSDLRPSRSSVSVNPFAENRGEHYKSILKMMNSIGQ